MSLDTSALLLPMQETIPIPVTTTLLMYLNKPTFKFSASYIILLSEYNIPSAKPTTAPSFFKILFICLLDI